MGKRKVSAMAARKDSTRAVMREYLTVVKKDVTMKDD